MGKGNDDKYEPGVLGDFQKSIDRYLAQKGKPYSIVRDREFSKSQETLKAKKKALRQLGKGRKPNKACELKDEEFEKMWESGQLGCHDPTSLLNTVWLNNAACLGQRAADEHKKVK